MFQIDDTNRPPQVNSNQDAYLPISSIEMSIGDSSNGKTNNSSSIENPTTNPFPVDAFPPEIQNIIFDTSKSLLFPIDFIASSMLCAAAVAIGKTFEVEVKRGWRESPIVNMALVGQPGTNKSHPAAWAILPIQKKDERKMKEYELKKIEYDNTQNLLAKEKREQSIENTVRPFFEKTIVQDITPEALAEVLKNNKRGIIVWQDELVSWVKNSGRYNKGSDIEIFLSIWSGKPIIIDRKSGEPIYIAKPCVSVFGTIQNKVLIELAKDGRSDNGFLDRILFVFPDNLKKSYWSDEELDPGIPEKWNRIISRLLNIPLTLDENDTPQPIVLTFTPDAKELLKEWINRNTDEMNDTDNETYKGILAKLEIYLSRLSLILQLLRYACNECDRIYVERKSVESAIKLIEYFKRCAIKVNAIINNTDPLQRYGSERKKLYESLPNVFDLSMGLAVAATHNISQRTFKEWVKDSNLFEKMKHGTYSKIIQ